MVAEGPRRAAGRLVLLAVAVSLLSSCADCFFKVEGKLVDCGTMAPLSGATITARIDQGSHGVRTLPATFMTSSAGLFTVHTDGTETCGAWATLMFRKDGYLPLDMQYKGAPKKQVDVCLSPVATP